MGDRAIQLRRRPVDDRMEHSVLSALITDSRVCRELYPLLREEYFTTPSACYIIRWVKNYFNLYSEAPKRHIEDVFNREAQQLDPTDASLISGFLSSLSEAYEREDSEFNVEYFIDQAMEFFDKQSLSLIKNNLDILLRTGRIKDAKAEVANYRMVSRLTGGWTNPFESTFVEQTLQDDIEDKILTFPGRLGDLMGWLQPGWLVGVFGPPKRGKTSYLMGFLAQALIRRIPTVFISHEMNKKSIAIRLYQRIIAAAEHAGNVRYPCMDCYLNQDGTCNNPRRTNSITLLNYDGKRPEYTPEMEYRPCTACRGQKNSTYIPDTWFETLRVPGLQSPNTVKYVKGFTNLYGHNNLRIKSYPPFSANIQQIKADLDMLEYTEGWVPRVIINDYADIVAPEDARQTGRDRIDETWKAHKNIAETRKCLVITASQTNRGSIGKDTVTQVDTAEDIRKINHVDCAMSLNQNDEEKRRGVMRIGIIAHRHKDFSETRHVTVLQQMVTGQPILDSEWTPPKRERRNSNEDDD